MDTEPPRDDASRVCPEAVEALTARFDGEIGNIADARLAAGLFLDTLQPHDPPMSPASRGNILLVVTELAANAIQYAPGPFTVRMHRKFEDVQVTVRDKNPIKPTPQPCDLARGTGGRGWPLIHALSRQVRVLRDPDGKNIHALMSW